MSKITGKKMNVHQNGFCVNCKRRTGMYKRKSIWPITLILLGVFFTVLSLTWMISSHVYLFALILFGSIPMIAIGAVILSKRSKDKTYMCGMCHSRITVDPLTMTDVDIWESSK